jgi:diguanylate cyclase (GGDEF)-like protein/PAS domain S-box-containing protein
VSVRGNLHPDPLLESAEQAAAAALRELPEALIVVFDQELRFLLSAGQALERAGDRNVCQEGEPLAGAFPADVWSSIEPLCRSALQGETRSREIWTARQRYCLMFDVGPLRLDTRDAAGASAAPAGGIAVVLDITQRRNADALAEHPDGSFEQVFERAPIGMGLLDTDGRWLLVNHALCDMTGYTAAELIGTRSDGIVHPDDVANDADQRARLLAGEIPAFKVEKRYFDAAGEIVSAILSMSLIRDRHGAPLQYIAQLQDVSERKRLEEDLRQLADHDPLTGLRNRKLFEHDLKLQIARSQRYGEVAGLIVIDLDAFEEINDRYGQQVADETLRALARALTRRLRQSDLVARLGGERFAVLLPHIDREGLAAIADSLSSVIPACSVDVGAGVLHPSASLGCVLVHEGVATAEQMLAAAERAMQEARSAKLLSLS